MARSALLNVMVQAAIKAGRSLSRDFGEVQNLQVSLKGPGDYVSQADRKAEESSSPSCRKRAPAMPS
jgi:myo-inositol-1(or 4)-monophosphatase